MTKVNNLTPFTFESTGESCFIRPVPVMLVREIERSIPKPAPPMQEVEGPDGTKRMEANRTHPDFLAALGERAEKLQEAMTALILKRGVVVKLSDEQRDDVKALREDMRESFGVTWDASDEVVWVKYIACATPADLRRLINEVTNRSVPSDPKSANGLSSSPSPSEATTSSESQPVAAA